MKKRQTADVYVREERNGKGVQIISMGAHIFHIFMYMITSQ